MQSIDTLAAQLNLSPNEWSPWGDAVGKVKLAAALDQRPRTGKLVLVSAITPTPAGEGKTTTSIGLTDGLRKRGVGAVAALRQPSLGPTLGGKGGGAGGGRARLEPFTQINLGLTGDIHAIVTAHNTLASLIDNALHFGREGASPLDARRIDFPRVLDLDERSLRKVVIGLGGPLDGVPRETRFDVAAASEVMAILCLARDIPDLKRRLGHIRVGKSVDGKIVTASELAAVPGMSALLADALRPNIVQTHEGSPALVHGGPFGNIAHGCSSVISALFGLRRAEVVVTEAGFGFDLGAEKFLDIFCRTAGVWPDASVVVATLRALKLHGGASLAECANHDPAALERGAKNLFHHVATARAYGLAPIVAINAFPDDRDDEIALLRKLCKVHEAECVLSRAYANGADGGLEMADAIMHALKTPAAPAKFAYELTDSPTVKIEKVAKLVYGATGVHFTQQAEKDLAAAEASGMGQAPICMAKTHLSLSADPKAGGLPAPHVLPIRAVRVSGGADFLVPLCGDIMTMPGLGRAPAILRMDLADDGTVTGVK
jgi:formate--tetrahydrofolate ligase